MNLVTKFYYWCTTYWPRLLPRTEDEFHTFKNILIDYYGVVDNAKSWTTICSHATSVPAYSLRKSYGYLANSAKRLVINDVLQKFRQIAVTELNKQLQAAVAKYQKENPQSVQEEQAAQQLT